MTLRTSRRACGLLTTQRSTVRQARWRNYAHPRYVAASSTGGGATALAELAARAAAGGRRRAAGRGHRVLHRRCRRSSRSPRPARSLFTAVLRPAGPARRGPAGRDVPARLRQPADPGREVALRPGRRGPGSSPALAAALRATPSADVVAPAARRQADARRRRRELWREWRARFQRAPRPLRAHRLQPGLRQPGAGRRPGPADRHAALLPARRGHRPVRTAGPARRPAGSRPPRPCSARLDPARRARVRPAAALGAGHRARSARTRSATSAWPGRSCAGCCSSWAGGWSAAGVVDRPEDVFWLRARRRSSAAPGRPQRGRGRGRKEPWRGPAAGHAAAAAARARLVPGVREHDAGRLARADRRRALAASAPAPAGSPRPPGCSPGRRTSAGCGPGDVLVASITTPAWTPLFAMASARGHRHRRAAEPQLDRGPRVRHPGRARHRRGHPPDHRTGRRSRVDGDAGTVTLPGATDQVDEPAATAAAGSDRARRARAAATAAAAAGYGSGRLASPPRPPPRRH